MTICRSSAALVTALAAATLAAPLATAQNPAPPPAGQTPAPAAATTTPVPAAHVVQAGETLWSLAQQYYGDPMLWPEIYRLNTDVVEDPHWIFPGEELRLQALTGPILGDSGAVAPTVVTITPTGDTVRAAPAPMVMNVDAPTIFSPSARANVQNNADLEVAAARAYRAVREGEYYSASFLSEGIALPTGRLLGNIQSSSIRRLSTSSTAMLFTDVAVEPTADSVRPGDLMIAMRREGDIRGYGDVLRPTGLLRVTGRTGRGQIAARVIQIYGSVNDGQEVMKIAPYAMDAAARPVDVTDGVAGEVIGLVNPGDVVTLQNGLFLNKGAQDGVRLGDLFTISGSDRTRNDFGGAVYEQAQAMVISVRPHTSTAVIVALSRPDVRVGSTARQTRRMPS